MSITIKVKKVNDKAVIPTMAHTGDACFDLRIVFPDGWNKTRIIHPHDTICVGSGLAFEIPEGYVMKIHVRSSIGIKRHLVLSNGTGIIDSGYRGEVAIALTNIGSSAASIADGERVCQCEICKVRPIVFEEVDALSDSERGTGGIGSSGRM